MRQKIVKGNDKEVHNVYCKIEEAWKSANKYVAKRKIEAMSGIYQRVSGLFRAVQGER